MKKVKYNIELSHSDYFKILTALRLKHKQLKSINTQDCGFPKLHDDKVKAYKKLLSEIYNLEPTR
jgi:hypothetical protein